jgi:DNA (cytosine-5)-methyltransferase 1
VRPRRSPHKPNVRDAIKRYPPIGDGEKAPALLNHETRKMMPHHKIIVQAVPKDGGSRQDIVDTSILLKCHREQPKVHKDVFGRMAWEQPSPTLTCRCTDVYCGRFVHPEQDRGLSLREAAALQTFRDDYKFFGTFFHIADQIGNAVPVKFARQLGLAITKSAAQMG